MCHQEGTVPGLGAAKMTAEHQLLALRVPKAQGHIVRYPSASSPTHDYKEVKVRPPFITANLGVVSGGARAQASWQCPPKEAQVVPPCTGLALRCFLTDTLRFARLAGDRNTWHHHGRWQERRDALWQNLSSTLAPTKGLLYNEWVDG